MHHFYHLVRGPFPFFSYYSKPVRCILWEIRICLTHLLMRKVFLASETTKSGETSTRGLLFKTASCGIYNESKPISSTKNERIKFIALNLLFVNRSPRAPLLEILLWLYLPTVHKKPQEKPQTFTRVWRTVWSRACSLFDSRHIICLNLHVDSLVYQ